MRIKYVEDGLKKGKNQEGDAKMIEMPIDKTEMYWTVTT